MGTNLVAGEEMLVVEGKDPVEKNTHGDQYFVDVQRTVEEYGDFAEVGRVAVEVELNLLTELV